MTRETLLEAIIQEVHRAVPEILELKPGCFIKYEDESAEKELVTSIEPPTDTRQLLVHLVGDEGRGLPLSWIKRHCEILGRPITLADILIAIGKKIYHPIDPSGLRFTVASGGLMYDEKTGKAAEWVLTAPLHDQPLPTLQFLYDLLVERE